MRNIVLASSSPYRQELLQRLQLTFKSSRPNIDESPHANEPPTKLVVRLAVEKAKKVAIDYPDAIIIGSDQVAVCNNEILGKPGNLQNAKQQLHFISGNLVIFYTGLCVWDPTKKKLQKEHVSFLVEFRQLNDEMIKNYLNKEPAFNCAGSFKSEALGIALTERMTGDDPTSLVGLPLITLTKMLGKVGVDII